jgi:hypothetical protein
MNTILLCSGITAMYSVLSETEGVVTSCQGSM